MVYEKFTDAIRGLIAQVHNGKKAEVLEETERCQIVNLIDRYENLDGKMVDISTTWFLVDVSSFVETTIVNTKLGTVLSVMSN